MYKKLFFAIFLAFLSCSVFADYYQFMPDNDLWKYDRINKDNNDSERAMFDKIIQIAKSVYDPIAQANNETLTINANWDDPTVNANTSRFWGSVTINMYGGLFRRPEISYEGFVFVLCHEIGHAWGGEPYINSWNKLAAEGQADYYGAKDCAKKVLPILNLTKYKFPPTQFMINTCNNNNLCLRELVAGQALGILLSVLKSEPIPNYETPDTTIVEETELSYPAHVQCRLDTYFNGTMNLDRPKCWFKN